MSEGMPFKVVQYAIDPQNLAYQGSQTNNIFDPGPLKDNTKYYWRIDSNGPGGTVMGDVWSANTTISAADTEDISSAEDTRN